MIINYGVNWFGFTIDISTNRSSDVCTAYLFIDNLRIHWHRNTSIDRTANGRNLSNYSFDASNISISISIVIEHAIPRRLFHIHPLTTDYLG